MATEIKIKKAPYGTWNSPVTADVLTQSVRMSLITVSLGTTYLTAAQSISFESILLVDRVTGELFHVERRPSEGGRSVIVNSTSHKDLVDKNWNVRTGVHEYVGVAATVSNGIIFFSNYTDGCVFAQLAIRPLNPSLQVG